MTHLALVPHGSPVVLPKAASAPASDKDVRQQIHSIYESYATMYPNPLLSQERQERDRLQRAISAASHATQLNPPPKQGTGWFSFLWGSRDKPDDQAVDRSAAVELDDRIQYVEDDTMDERLCGTDSLDLDCIPPEAHAFARFHLASMRTRGERPNAVRATWEVAGSSVLLITGLGELVEYSRQGGEGRRQFTSDREHLQGFVSSTGTVFNVAYARAATIGPNLLVVSWGLPDGLVMFYRRLVGREAIAWEPVACLSASEAVKANIGDVFLEETGSALLRVSDICPLVFEVPDAPPTACVAVGRLGGYIEIVTLPTGMWYGPEIDPPRSKRSSGWRRKGSVEHYATNLQDLTMDPSSIVALTTAAYALDCICLETFRTNLSTSAVWDGETYPDAPPAEFVLAATGFSTKGSGEVVCLWSVSSLSPSAPDAHSKGFNVFATLTETVHIGRVGPDITVFASSAIMNLWRRPRQLQLGVEERDVSVTRTSERVVTISVPIPLVSMRFAVESNSDAIGCLLDGNGGAALVDCSLLNRFVSQTLTRSEYELLFHNDEDEDVPLVRLSASRMDMADRLLSEGSGVGIADIQFLGKRLATGGPLLAALLPDAGLRVVDPLGSSDALLMPPVVATSLLRFSFAGLILASRSSYDDDTTTLTTAIVKPLDSRAAVESLVELSDYSEAVRAVSQLTAGEQENILDSMDVAYRRLWEETASFEAFEKVSDTAYVLDQAFSMSSALAIDATELFTLFRKVHCHALERMTSGIATSLSSDDRLDAEAMIGRLKDRLVKLGSYELLCGHLGLEKDFDSFCHDFLLVNIASLASDLAQSGEVLALSILWFRHIDELQDRPHLLSAISPSISPLAYSHLLPVRIHRDSRMFLSTHDDAVILRRWHELPDYLLDAYDLPVVVGDEDRAMVLERCPSVSDICSDVGQEWYCNRMRTYQRFGASIQDTRDLCRLGLRAFPPVEGSDNELERLARYVDGLDSVPEHTTGTQLPLGRLETSPLNLLEKMELSKLVEMVFDEFVDLSTINNRFQLGLLSLVGSSDRDAIEQALLSYCIRGFDPKTGEASVKELFLALERSVACGALSSPSKDIESRLFRSSTLLFQLVESSFAETINVACGLSLNEFQCRRVIDYLWSLYETLPTRIDADIDNGDHENHTMADEMFEALVVLSILSEWPGCHAFNIVQSAEGDLLHEHVLRCLCRSFCGQSTFQESLVETLLLALLSDIRELERVSFSTSFAIAPILTTELFLPLFRTGKISLLGKFLGASEPAWIDWEMVSESITSFVNEVVYADGDIAQALEYQSLLVQHLPDACDKIAAVQRALDAAHFINTVLLADDDMDLIHPGYCLNNTPADVLDSVLSINPYSLICGCGAWKDPSWAEAANMRLRSCHDDSYRSDQEHEVGQALFHLAKLLGLHDSLSICRLTCRLIIVGVASKLYGASAALCRTLIRRSKEYAQQDLALILHATREVVCQDDYADPLTKQELCSAVLRLPLVQSSKAFDPSWILTLPVMAGVEYALSFPKYKPDKGLFVSRRLFYDTICEYQVDLGDLFVSLRRLASRDEVDDSLLETISRYTVYWCIAHFTRKLAYTPPAVEGVFARAYVHLYLAMVTHISDRSWALESLQAIQGIVDEQCSVIPSQSGAGTLNSPDPIIVNGLIHRGYSLNGARRAALAAGSAGFDSALQWAVGHSLDPTFDAPVINIKDDQELYVDAESCAFLKHLLHLYHAEIPQVSCFLTSSGKDKTQSDFDYFGWEGDASLANISCSEGTEGTSNVSGHSQLVELSEGPEYRSICDDQFKALKSDCAVPAVTDLPNAEDQTEGDNDSAVPVKTINNAAEQCAEPETTVHLFMVPEEVNGDEGASNDETTTAPAGVAATNTRSNSGVGVGLPLVSSPMVRESTSRATLLESGHKALQVARNSVSPSNEERKRLIEEGRRLLQQARGTLAAPASAHRYPLRSMKRDEPQRAPSTETNVRSPAIVPLTTILSEANNGHLSVDRAKPVISPATNGDAAWDFDDDDLGQVAADDGDGWDFDEDLT